MRKKLNLGCNHYCLLEIRFFYAPAWMLFVCRRLPANEKILIPVRSVPLWLDPLSLALQLIIPYRIYEIMYKVGGNRIGPQIHETVRLTPMLH